MQGRKTEAHTETSGWYLKQQKEQSIKNNNKQYYYV